MQTPLVATYRVQLQPGFDFNAAASVVDYLAGIGISHLYCSPCLQAAPGSTHGYDVVDPTSVSAELGGTAGFTRLCDALHRAGMGLILDVVPNHMAISGRANAWWWDVLENGPSSLYARHFDVDWDPPESKFRNLILVPILGDRYGKVLESGELALHREGGHFYLRYYEHELPIGPRSLEDVLNAAAMRAPSDELSFLAGAFGRLPQATRTDFSSAGRRHRDKAVLARLLERLCTAQPAVAEAIDAVLSEWQRLPAAMDALLKRQNYRLAFWRNAEREMGYRRFFDINSLIALRVEDENVFHDTHGLILHWVREGKVDGLRIDHVDGLRNPGHYLRRLREAAPKAWVVVEKILQPDELLPADWPVAGTTGYDFLAAVNGLFVHPQARTRLTEFYVEFTEESTDFAEVVHDRKELILSTSLGADVNRLTSLLLRISGSRPVSQDFTRHELHEALREVVAGFPVYRTYIVPDRGSPAEGDSAIIQTTITTAKQRREDLDARLFSFLEDLLLLRLTGRRETEFVQRFQQLCAPTIAKGVEDTAFYDFNRFVALNEVGGEPDHFATSLATFHEGNARRQVRWPESMLTTSTHDTKRSEDVRARLAVLSEMPDDWCAAVERWSTINEPLKTNGYPDRNTEYLLYQTLVGAWPIELERLSAYALKAAREAKRHTSWTDQNAEYEEALGRFVEGILGNEPFVRDLEAFVEPLVVPGRINALAQVLVKLTAPGVPDTYQGTELWDLSLVDPDNRRPVDFDRRRALLAESADKGLTLDQIAEESGTVKLELIRRALAVRQRLPLSFGPEGSYEPLLAEGRRSDHVVAFIRGGEVITVVPRWWPTLPRRWENTTLTIPPGRWHNELTAEETNEGARSMESLLKRFPVALLTIVH
ncbi:MAG: malto-oligosyltrehalose synthase [Phycisphaerae bacterium]|nr:malto-oligosyltrehalose synthase [Phycisphaerae bacterium]